MIRALILVGALFAGLALATPAAAQELRLCGGAHDPNAASEIAGVVLGQRTVLCYDDVDGTDSVVFEATCSWSILHEPDMDGTTTGATVDVLAVFDGTQTTCGGSDSNQVGPTLDGNATTDTEGARFPPGRWCLRVTNAGGDRVRDYLRCTE